MYAVNVQRKFTYLNIQLSSNIFWFEKSKESTAVLCAFITLHQSFIDKFKLCEVYCQYLLVYHDCLYCKMQIQYSKKHHDFEYLILYDNEYYTLLFKTLGK